MKKIFILLILIISILLVSGCNNNEEQTNSDKEIEGKTEEVEKVIDKTAFKVLSIGNSFSDNATKHLYEIAKAYGFEEVIIGNLFIGGCDISTHRVNAAYNNANYIYRKASAESDGVIVNTPNSTMEYGILDEDWQYITLQQQSTKAGLTNSFEFLPQLADYVKSKATNKDVKIFWHMTWAYAWENNNSGFVNFDNDQYVMYEAIVNATKTAVLPVVDFDGVIPSGTAIQNARTGYLGDTFTVEDGYHLNTRGEYVAGMAFVLALTGITNEELDKSKIAFTLSYDLDSFIEATTNAIADPFNITLSNILERPY